MRGRGLGDLGGDALQLAGDAVAAGGEGVGDLIADHLDPHGEVGALAGE